jgi:hypothetical protein
MAADGDAALSVRFGSLCIQLEPAKPKREPGRAAQPPPKRAAAATIRFAPTAQPARPNTDYATVCESALCWHCCGELADRAKRMPAELNKIRRAYRLVGYFCSWECARAYSIGLADNAGVGARATTFTQMYHELYDELPPPVRVAPPRVAQRAFGGPLAPAEFRAEFDHALNARPFLTRMQRVACAAPGEWFAVGP